MTKQFHNSCPEHEDCVHRGVSKLFVGLSEKKTPFTELYTSVPLEEIAYQVKTPKASSHIQRKP